MSPKNPQDTDPFQTTIETYNQKAQQYVEDHQGAGYWDRLTPGMERFLTYLQPGARVLDIGCGPGKDIIDLRAHGHQATGIDYSTGMLAQAKRHAGGPLIQADMRFLPLPDACMDGIWMCASLLHLPREDAPQALSETRRILRPGGVFCVIVIQGEGEGIGPYLGSLAFTYYQEDDFAQRVKAAIHEQWIVRPIPDKTWIIVISKRA